MSSKYRVHSINSADKHEAWSTPVDIWKAISLNTELLQSGHLTRICPESAYDMKGDKE